jgi:prophage antirepressor-like protein
MCKVIDFSFNNLNVRTALKNSDVLFCLADVANCLNIQTSSKIINRLDKDGVYSIQVTDTLGRQQEANFISEPNLYRVIFRSDKPEAIKFQDWVFNEVLPALRKNGEYKMGIEDCGRKNNGVDVNDGNVNINDNIEINNNANINDINNTPTNTLADNKPKHLTLTPDQDGFSSLSICFSKLRYIVEDDMPLFYLNDIDRLLEVTRLNHIDQERTENNYTIHHILYDYNLMPHSRRISNREHLFLTLLQLAEFCNRYKTKRSLMLLETLERQSVEYGGNKIEQTRKKLLTITA